MRLKIWGGSALLNNDIHLCIFLFLQVRTDHLASECGKVVRAAVKSVGESLAHACLFKEPRDVGRLRNGLVWLPVNAWILGHLTLNPLTTTIVAPPSIVSKWQMGFNSAFKGLNSALHKGGWLALRPGRFTPGKELVPILYRRSGGSEGRSGRVWNISPPPGFDPRTVQPVASRPTDWGIAAQLQRLCYIKLIYFLMHLLVLFL